MKSTEGMFDESVVYVTKQGAQVRASDGRIVLFDPGAEDDED